MTYRPVDPVGLIRTDLYCHQCDKNFIAMLDYGVNGNHMIRCPRCHHIHCRVITDGLITDDRWDSKADQINVDTSRIWTAADFRGSTYSAAHYIRDSWLQRSDLQL